MNPKDSGYWGAGYVEDWQATRRHMQGCGIKSWKDLDDEFRWTEFGGTFTSHDPEKHGMQIRITCDCGQLKDQLYRYEGAIGPTIRDFLEVMDIMIEDGDDDNEK
jgi:hypothetical protein